MVIENAAIFDSENGTIIEENSILIRDGVIQEVGKNIGSVSTRVRMDIQGKLVTPGFIDVHTHLTDILGEKNNVAIDIHPDSVTVYRLRR